MTLNLIPSHYSGQNDVHQLHKSLLLWTISLLIIAGISVYGAESIDPIWGIVLVIVAIITWKYKSPAMFIVYAVIMGWAALINSLSILFGQVMDKLWTILGLLEIVWTVLVVRQYGKYRHLQVGNEALVLRHFGRGSAILSGVLLFMTPFLCTVLFMFPLDKGALAAQTAQLEQNPLQLDMLAFYTLMDLAVLTFGLGLAVIISEKNNTGPAVVGVVLSALMLAGLLVFFSLGAIGQLMT